MLAVRYKDLGRENKSVRDGVKSDKCVLYTKDVVTCLAKKLLKKDIIYMDFVYGCKEYGFSLNRLMACESLYLVFHMGFQYIIAGF